MSQPKYADDPEAFTPSDEEEVDRWYAKQAEMDSEQVDEMMNWLFLTEDERADRAA